MARNPYILPGLGQQITARLNAYGTQGNQLNDLQFKTNHTRDEIQRLQSWLNNAAASGFHPERALVENKLGLLQQDLAQFSTEEQELRQRLEAERNSLLQWVLNSPLVLNVPYAIHCKSIHEIYAVHVLRSRIATWPDYYVFRIAVGWTTHAATVQELQEYAESYQFQVVPLINF